MFIRVKSTPNSPRKTVQIVENIRNGRHVSQKIVHYLGVASNDEEEAKLRALGQQMIIELEFAREQASNQQSLFPVNKDEIKDAAELRSDKKKKAGRPKKGDLSQMLPTNQVNLSDLTESHRIIEGIHDIGGLVYKQIGFSNLLKRKKDNDLLADIVLSRIFAPASKRGQVKNLVENFDKTYNVNQVYGLMDKVCGRINSIKSCVFNATRKLFTSKVNLLFFDVTTLYFESIEEDELRKFGYSKDFRFNTTQLVLALASDENGLPIGYELFPGNKAEVSTLIEVLNKWREQFEIGSVCMVGDRAMLSDKNLQLLEENNIEYIVAAKLKKLKKDFTEELFEEANYKINVVGDQLAWVGEFTYKARRLIVSYKSKRAQKDRKDRVRLIEKVQKLVNKKTQQIASSKVVTNAALKKYTIADGKKSNYRLNEEKILEDAKWDGLHGVVTNIKESSPTEILSIYARLWVIEDCFRVNKHSLKMRPIYHWVPPRIEAHIAICYMGFAVLRHLQYRVNLTTKLSVHEIIDVLKLVQSSILLHIPTGNYYRMPGATSQKASKIYKSFGLVRSQSPAPYLK